MAVIVGINNAKYIISMVPHYVAHSCGWYLWRPNFSARALFFAWKSLLTPQY